MYCFEFDETICDCRRNLKFPIRIFKTFNGSVCINPFEFDIRWSIITCRPNLDKFFIKTYCFLHGLVPCDIICANNFTYFKQDILSYQFKLNYFKRILDGDIKPKYTEREVTKIIHVANSKDENSYINFNRQNYPIVSVNAIDFQREFFNNII